jgi:hypothetical protein
VQCRGEYIDEAVSDERRPSGEHLEQNGPNREQVAARIEILRHELFGCHVSRSTDQHSAACEVA